MCWQIKQTINIIKNASQETICSDIPFNKCPPEDTISTIRDAKNEKFVNIKNEITYGNQYCDMNVYETPYNKNQYPYAYSIRVMVQSLSMIDLINLDFKKDKWNTPYANVYFKERYHYYLDYLLDNAPNVFILPILQFVGATTLIRNRHSRIQPCGVIFDETFVDEDMQTPCNFFWHDLNHARRIYQNNLWYSTQNNMSIEQLYETMSKDVKQLLPIKNWLSNTDKKYESLIKMLLFEVVHEDALPFTNNSIINDILFKSRQCYPYERTYDNIETDNNNNRINLRFYEQGASTLRTLYNKLRHTFFEKEIAQDIITDIETRNIPDLKYASYLLLKKIDPRYKSSENATLKELEELIKDRTFEAHDYKKLNGILLDPDDFSWSRPYDP